MKRLMRIIKTFGVKFTLILVLSMVFSAALSDILLSRLVLKAQFNELRDKLRIIAQEAVLLVDPGELRTIPLTPAGENVPAYRKITQILQNVKDLDPSIEYIYIMSKTDKEGILRFIVDLEVNKPSHEIKKTAHPGDYYDGGRFPAMIKGFTGPAADANLVTDEWGSFLSGYAPIRDADGKSIAILGIDIAAPEVKSIRQKVRERFLTILVVGIIVSLILGIIISRRIAGPINELIKGAGHIAAGDLGFTVKVRGEDEIASLASVFNKMSGDLITYTEELKHITAERERYLKELEIAKGIQESFLPEHAPAMPHVEIVASCVPAEIVGGDFYDFIPIDKTRWGLAIGDASGKGMPAALFMALSRTLLKASARGNPDITATIRQANELIFEDDKANMFLTLFYAVLNAERTSLEYVNAGHNPPIVIRREKGETVFLKTDGIPLGLFRDMSFSVGETSLAGGDVVVFYTDGITEAVNDRNDAFGADRLIEVIRRDRMNSAGQILSGIQTALKEFVGSRSPFDDSTLVVIKIT
ncbi:MAG: SpoIIE family protein phosphatase [Candidatus Omnitrophica bacterium]|nr:SpoIIE family protein phosphatase [Candidatus Omnitrophota bacterium]